MDGRFGSIAALILFVIIFIYGALNDLLIFSTVAFIAIVCLCVNLSVSKRIVVNPRIAIIAAVATLVGILIMSAFFYDPGTIDRVVWGHVSGIMYWMAAYPVSFLILETLAINTGAKYNYPLLSGLPVFIVCAQEVLAWIVVSIFCMPQIDSEQIASVEVIASMITGIMLSIVAGIFVSRIAKRKRFVLNEETSGVKR
jgi:hypothetical protein